MTTTATDRAVLPKSSVASRVQRLHPALPEILKFVLIGGLCSGLDLVVANALHFLVGMGPTLAKALSTLVATAASYAGNRAWSFGHRVDNEASQPRDIAVFTLINLLGLAITLVPVDLVHYGLGLTSVTAFNASSIAGTVVATVFRFWAYRRFVFTAPAARPPRAWTAPPELALDVVAGPSRSDSTVHAAGSPTF